MGDKPLIVGGAYGAGVLRTTRLGWNWWVMGGWCDSGWIAGVFEGCFSTLFTVATSKEAWVEELWSSSVEGHCRTPCFRPFSDWELKDLENFLLRLQGRRIYSVEDRVV